MKKIKLTCAYAIVKHLIAQKILIDGKKEPLFAGAFGIFGHGNVACLGQALEENKDKLPTWRGHHEQNMALTGIAYARAKRRKQIFVATSSVGPGSTNMITSAAVAMSNRLPILFLPGDTFFTTPEKETASPAEAIPVKRKKHPRIMMAEKLNRKILTILPSYLK